MGLFGVKGCTKVRLADDRGTSILLEYVLSLIILSILFTLILLVLNDTIRNTNNMVLDKQLGVIANDVANRISLFSNDVNNNRQNNSYYNTSIYEYSTTLNLPELVQNEEYYIDIRYDSASKNGNITVYYGPSNMINSTASFHSNVTVVPSRIHSSWSPGKISYDYVNGRIIISG